MVFFPKFGFHGPDIPEWFRKLSSTWFYTKAWFNMPKNLVWESKETGEGLIGNTEGVIGTFCQNFPKYVSSHGPPEWQRTLTDTEEPWMIYVYFFHLSRQIRPTYFPHNPDVDLIGFNPEPSFAASLHPSLT